MPAQGPGGSTPFENMSHEQMLAWLDQANAGTVQSAADRLIAAAKEIRKIADELKVRPQWVEWKGEGADAFRTWTADLANSTLRLGDFSEDAAKWLGQASGAIAAAQASIPRDMPSATANLAAANSARNDPDAAAVSAKSRSELEALEADREKVRLEAAAQMRKLAQSYQVSTAQMGALERPKFPPPPEAISPPAARRDVDGGGDKARSGVSEQVASPSVNAPISHTRSDVPDPRQSSGVPSTERRPQVDVDQPTRMGIDSVDTLLPRTPGPHAVPEPLPGTDQLKGGPTPQTGTAPPAFGTPVNNPAGQGRSPATGRMPFPPGQGATANPTRMPAVGGGSGNGIVGGRPVPQSPGKSMGIPRGTVVGGEGTALRGPMGPTAGSTNPGGRVMGQQGPTGQTGQTPGRRPSVSNGGVVGGRPLPNDGVGNTRPQQPGRAGATGARPGTPGTPGAPGTATGPGTAGRGVVGGTPGTGRHGEGHGAGGIGASQQPPARRTSSGNGRPYGVVEDEETWRQGTRPAVPPVIDRRTQE